MGAGAFGRYGGFHGGKRVRQPEAKPVSNLSGEMAGQDIFMSDGSAWRRCGRNDNWRADVLLLLSVINAGNGGGSWRDGLCCLWAFVFASTAF